MTSEMAGLVRRAQSGDPGACASLLRAWEPIVRRVVRRLIVDPFDADDVVQESLVSALTGVAQLRDAGRSTQWLSSIARNMAISFIRRPRVQRLLDDVPERTDLESEHDSARMRLLVRAAVADLSPIRRDAVVQHYYRGLSYVEAADAIGVSVDTVRSRLQKARIALKEAVCTMERHKPERYTLSRIDLSTLHLILEATIVDERHPELQGVLLDTEGWAVATDGRRFIRRRIAGLRGLTVPVLLGPWRGAEALFRTGNASVQIGPQAASFHAESGESHDIRIMDLQFPNYQAIIPTQIPACSLAVHAGALLFALDRLMPEVAAQRSPVTIDVSDGLLALKVRWKEHSAEATIRIAASECSSQTGLFSTCIEARYMDSSIRGLQPGDDDLVRISMYGQSRPVRFALPQREQEVALVAPLPPAGAA